MGAYTDKILSILLTQGREGSEISSRVMYWSINPENVTLQVFQRMITKELEEFQEKQYELALDGKPFYFVTSNDKGYYVATNEDEAINGLLFYQSRIQPMFARRKKIKTMIALKFKTIYKEPKKVIHDENQIDIFE